MVADLASMAGVACTRCQQEPHMKECLGCGEPPTKEEPSQTLWRLDEDGRLISPAESVKRGGPAFKGLGYGQVRTDWPWCPRWFHVYSEATIDWTHTAELAFRLYSFREKGALEGFSKPPWTMAMVQLLDLLDTLEMERREMEQEKRERERRRRKG